MLSFTKWLNKIKRKKKDERSTSQGNREIGTENKQGQTDRDDQEIGTEGVFVFTEPGK